MVDDSGITLGSFGVVGAIFALQFFAEVPKVRKDILQVSGFSVCSWLEFWLVLQPVENCGRRRKTRGEGEAVSEQQAIYRENTKEQACRRSIDAHPRMQFLDSKANTR